MPEQWCPIFVKDGNDFIVPVDGFYGATEEEAKMVGLGTMLVECVLWRARYTGRVVEVSGGIPHRTGDLQGTPVCLTAGPLFQEAEVGP